MDKKEKTIKISVNVRGIFRNVKTGKITDRFEAHNLVVNVGLNSIASRLSGIDSPANKKGTITYCALGTSTTAADQGDTALVAESIRKLVSVRSVASNVAKFRTFFNTSEGNINIREIGLFGDDASSTPDSGTLFARLIVSRDKTDAETLTLDWEVTVAAG